MSVGLLDDGVCDSIADVLRLRREDDEEGGAELASPDGAVFDAVPLRRLERVDLGTTGEDSDAAASDEAPRDDVEAALLVPIEAVAVAARALALPAAKSSFRFLFWSAFLVRRGTNFAIVSALFVHAYLEKENELAAGGHDVSILIVIRIGYMSIKCKY